MDLMKVLTAEPGPNARVGSLRENVSVLEWFRYGAEQFLLVPAATWLPLSVSLGLADAIGSVDYLIPGRTKRGARAQAEAAGMTGRRAEQQARRRLQWYRRDLVWRQRMRTGRERMSNWTLIERNPAPVHELIAAKRSFIAAGGHFTSAAGDLRHMVLPVAGKAVGGALPRWRLSPFALRRRLDARVDKGSRERMVGLDPHGNGRDAMRAEVPDLWAPNADWAKAPAHHNAQDQLLAELAVPGTVSQILIDAPWEKPNAYRRPFAGIGERGFALGAARIARLAQAPIVPFVAVLGDEPRTVIFEWGNPIMPGRIDDKASDRAVIDEALAFIEGGVARYPAQYLHDIGQDYSFAAEAVKRRRLARLVAENVNA